MPDFVTPDLETLASLGSTQDDRALAEACVARRVAPEHLALVRAMLGLADPAQDREDVA